MILQRNMVDRIQTHASRVRGGDKDEDGLCEDDRLLSWLSWCCGNSWLGAWEVLFGHHRFL